MTDYESIDVFVLAGGQSSRMGMDKGLMMLGEKPMVCYILDTLASFPMSVSLVANDDAYLQAGVPVINDKVTGKGPMGGLITALYSTKKKYILLLSCDMPFISREAIERLLGALQDSHQVTVASVMTKINPLFAIYQQQMIVKVSNCMADHCLKMTDLVHLVTHRQVPMDDLLVKDPFLFININSPAEIEKSKEKWKKKP